MTVTPQDGRVLPVAGVTVAPDRRYRRSESRQDRRRLGRRIVRAVLWSAAGFVAVAAGWWVFDYLGRADALMVRDVEIHGNARLSSSDVDVLLKGLRGENIFAVDLDGYRHRLLDSPWVADVSFRRALPSTIDIQIVERAPLAIARLGEQLYLVDDTGVIVDEYSAAYADLDLPIVDGLLSAASADGPLTDRVRVQLVAGLFSALSSEPELTRRLSQVNVVNDRDAVVMFDTYPVWLHLGNDRFVERVQTFFEIAPTLHERFAEIDSVDLRFDDRVFVRSGRRRNRVVPTGGGLLHDAVEQPSAGRVSEDAHGA